MYLFLEIQLRAEQRLKVSSRSRTSRAKRTEDVERGQVPASPCPLLLDQLRPLGEASPSLGLTLGFNETISSLTWSTGLALRSRDVS